MGGINGKDHRTELSDRTTSQDMTPGALKTTTGKDHRTGQLDRTSEQDYRALLDRTKTLGLNRNGKADCSRVYDRDRVGKVSRPE